MRFSNKYFLILSLFIIFSLILLILVNSICFNWIELNEESDRLDGRVVSNKLYKPVIYVITPTHHRWVQKAELIRLSHTLLLAQNIHWIVVEDSPLKTQLVTKFIKQIQNYGDLNVTHLNVLTPPQYKMRSSDPNWLKPRGVLQRNAGIQWIRNNIQMIDKKGVIYFGDDDNTYDLKLFDEMRSTKRVSVWPVGLVGGLIVEKPIVSNGKVIAWNTMWKKERQFPIDMSGFAVSTQLLLNKPNAYFSLEVNRGLQETYFIQQLISSIEELEPKANNCKEVLVFHTRTEAPNLKQEQKLNIPSNEGFDL